MSNKKYLVGDKIGPHKCLFLEEVSAKRRSGKFLCGQCNKNYFISRVDAVVSGSTWRCTDCSNQKSRKRQETNYDLRNKKFGKLIALNPIQRRNKNKNVIWYCKCDCGNYTEVESLNLRTGHTTSCGICQKSKGEQKIKNILDSANIRYFHEYTFEDCINPKTGRKLRFDFYLPDYNCCIEYNGKQHYSKEGTWYKDKENDFYECLERDVIKKEYCRMNSLQLVRISFLEYNKITLDYLLNKILIDKK